MDSSGSWLDILNLKIKSWRPHFNSSLIEPHFLDLTCCLCSIRYKVAYKKDTGECRLEISMTFADDAGEYCIFAKNQLGEVSASIRLLDEGKRSTHSVFQMMMEWIWNYFPVTSGIWCLHEETGPDLQDWSDPHGAAAQSGRHPTHHHYCQRTGHDHRYLWTGRQPQVEIPILIDLCRILGTSSPNDSTFFSKHHVKHIYSQQEGIFKGVGPSEWTSDLTRCVPARIDCTPCDPERPVQLNGG